MSDHFVTSSTLEAPAAEPCWPLWPAMVCDEQGQDFAYVPELESLAEQLLWRGCRLIDSYGWVYILSQRSNMSLYWQRQVGLVSLPELNHELKRYAANLGVCCTVKLAIRTLADAFALVAWLEQQ